MLAAPWVNDVPSHNLSRRDYLKLSTLGAATALCPPLAQAAPRPSFLVICSDQQHWQAQGFSDAFFDTPAQDELARRATVFSQAFCTTPQCSPSRSSMLTGFYPHHTKMLNNMGAAGGVDLQVPTIATTLQEAGYTTGYFGKWHLGQDPIGNAGWSERVIADDDAVTTRRALEFVSRQVNRSEPFALFVMYLNPHDIYHYRPDARRRHRRAPLPPSWHASNLSTKPPAQLRFMTQDQGTLMLGRPQKDWEGYRHYYRAMVRRYDDHVGQLAKALDTAQLSDRTVIVATSDHGDMDCAQGLIFKGPFMYEHTVRVPLTIHVPASFGGVGAHVVDDWSWSHVDLVPTLLDLADIPYVPAHGQSVRKRITGNMDRSVDRDVVIAQYYGKQQWLNPIRMVRTREFKYNVYLDGPEELYHLSDDPHEIVNLAKDHGYTRQKRVMRDALAHWLEEMADPFFALKVA